MPPTDPLVLRIVRRFDASRERVFDAWLAPETNSQWLFNSGGERITNEIDARPGGTWLMTDRQGGKDYTACGEYIEINRPRRLVFTFKMPQFSRHKDKITVEIKAVAHGCTLSFVQEGMDIRRELKALADGELSETEKGWTKMFDSLEAILRGSI